MHNPTFIDKLRKKVADHWVGGLIGAVLSMIAGMVLFYSTFGDELTRWSYDLPYIIGRAHPPPEAIIVYLDAASHEFLEQPENKPWDRTLHAKLVDRMTELKAKAVVFDIVFSDPGPNPEADQKFADALKANGKCVLSADYIKSAAGMETLEMPVDILKTNAASHGIVTLSLDPNFTVRRAWPSTIELPSLPWVAAEVAGAEVTRKFKESPPNIWLHYYGPPGVFRSISFSQAVNPDESLPELFKDKIVFVGAKQSTGFSGAGKDEFGTAYTSLTKSYAPGVEIHATETINLIRQDWLRRFPNWLELLALILVGASFGFALTKVRPVGASLVSIAAAIATVLIVLAFFRLGHIWFAWLIALVQITVALFWSMLFNSLRWYVERRLMVDSLQSYLSPGRAQQVLKNPKLLQPGGEEQEVSILFSDIAGYSKITGRMDTSDIFLLLNKYYETTLTCVHQTDGTVVQLIGDAIFAVWNAPLPQVDHQARACQAALLLRDQLVEFDAAERSLPLRTRIGLHTGLACVGNLGSKKRFVYAAIGDSTNLASRLEGLNKHLGTQILASRSTQKAIPDQMVSRLVGHFRFKGFDKVVEVHELLDKLDKAEASKAWRESFADALHNFQRKAFDEAARGFHCTIELRKEDGPSKFYLEQIEYLRAATLAYDWAGEVDLKEK